MKKRKQLYINKKSLDFKDAIYIFKNAKKVVRRDVITAIVKNLMIQIKSGSYKIENTKMEKKAGKNQIVQIINIDNLFVNVNNFNAKEFIITQKEDISTSYHANAEVRPARCLL